MRILLCKRSPSHSTFNLVYLCMNHCEKVPCDGPRIRTKPLRHQTRRSLSLLSHDTQGAGVTLRSLGCLFHTFQFGCMAVQNFTVALSVCCRLELRWPLHRCHFPSPGYSRQGTGHSQLPNSHAN